MNTPVKCILALAVGVVGGYLLGLGMGKQQVSQSEEQRYQKLLAEKDALIEEETANVKRQALEEAMAQVIAWVPMPEPLREISLTDLLDAKGPMNRYQAIIARVQDIPTEKLQSELDAVRGKMRAGFETETLFATHLLLARMGAEDFKGATAYLSELSPDELPLGLNAVLAAGASTDPAQVLKFLKGDGATYLENPKLGEHAAGGVAREWAKKSPAEALAWAKTLPEPARGGALQNAVTGIATTDPERAASVALELEPDEDRITVLGSIASEWAARDPAKAMEWARSLKSDKESDRAHRDAIDGWAEANPDKAAEFVTAMESGDAKFEAIGDVGARWAAKDPAKAAEWVAAQEECDGTERATAEIMRIWTASSPEKASEWLTLQREGSTRDHGAMGLADTLAHTDPGSAMDWIASISDADQRMIELLRRTQVWMDTDPDAAKNWIANATRLSAEDRELLEGEL